MSSLPPNTFSCDDAQPDSKPGRRGGVLRTSETNCWSDSLPSLREMTRRFKCVFECVKGVLVFNLSILFGIAVVAVVVGVSVGSKWQAELPCVDLGLSRNPTEWIS